jgi:hypothetical protein
MHLRNFTASSCEREDVGGEPQKAMGGKPQNERRRLAAGDLRQWAVIRREDDGGKPLETCLES